MIVYHGFDFLFCFIFNESYKIYKSRECLRLILQELHEFKKEVQESVILK